MTTKIQNLPEMSTVSGTDILPITDISENETKKVTVSQLASMVALGAQGATGARGITGLQGPTGTVGAVGSTGLAGLTGIRGITGLQGPTGLAGTNGFQGVTGRTGLQGITGLGSNGPTGLRGLTGLQGETGIQGNTGAGIAGTTGIPGPQGTTGAQGNTGAGVAGPQGSTGVQGADGGQGATGIQGITGLGLAGATGLQGGTGIGSQGATGIQGVTGPSAGGGGSAGTAFSMVRAYADFIPTPSVINPSTDAGSGLDEVILNTNGFTYDSTTNRGRITYTGPSGVFHQFHVDLFLYSWTRASGGGTSSDMSHRIRFDILRNGTDVVLSSRPRDLLLDGDHWTYTILGQVELNNGDYFELSAPYFLERDYASDVAISNVCDDLLFVLYWSTSVFSVD